MHNVSVCDIVPSRSELVTCFAPNPEPNFLITHRREQKWVQMRHKRWNNLDEIYAGVCDGMTYKEIEVRGTS